MSSTLSGKLQRTHRMLEDILENEGPLPRDVEVKLQCASDDLRQALGARRIFIRNRYEVGDDVTLHIRPRDSNLDVMLLAKVIAPPKKRSPNDFEEVDGKMWYFTSDLPAAVTAQVDMTMHVDTGSDRREMFHLTGEHWSTWHEKNGKYWTIVTVIPEGN